MAINLSALEAEVARNTEVVASAITLIQGLAAAVEATSGDPARVLILAENLRGQCDALAAAVAANTPAAPPDPPVDPIA